jgi:N-acetylmuramoyl-L-alanine amidase
VKKVLGLTLLACLASTPVALAQQKQPLQVVFPRDNHQTSAEKIFFLGTAPSDGQVLINGKPINRSQSGHFAPSFPLQMGENLFTLQHESQQLQIKVIRTAGKPEIPQGSVFAPDSLLPSTDIARLPGEEICFTATALPNTNTAVKLGIQKIPLLQQPSSSDLPNNLSALTNTNAPTTENSVSKYAGCTIINNPGELGKPEFQFTNPLVNGGKTITQQGKGGITILSPAQLPVVEVTVDDGLSRTGSNSDFSRLTPIPKGVRATVTGKDGEWLRLDYGAWVNAKETRPLPGSVAPRNIIRSILSRQQDDATNIIFPMELPVPVTVQQGSGTLTLTLYNTTAQTDIVRLDDNPFISRLDWQQIAPGKVQYTFNLKKQQQWGYNLKYEGTSLILSLRHSPEDIAAKKGRQRGKPLAGIKILLDPGHGGKESGASGPNGILEKDVNLTLSKMIREELIKRGAEVVMTMEEDKEVSLPDRQAIIAKEQPTISISVHHNSLPDNGDAENTKGIGIFWYHPQAHSLSIFMHNYLVQKLKRPSYGVFWNNLALARPAAAPSVLLEVGFMSNPTEFEMVTNKDEQKKFSKAVAQSLVEWFKSVKSKK